MSSRDGPSSSSSRERPVETSSTTSTSTSTTTTTTSESEASDSKSASSDRSEIASQVDGSFVEYFGYGVSTCGYCKQADSSIEGRASYDMMLYKVTPIDYQVLLDRGWRRSGHYCYRPDNKNCCCPNYPILCEANKFKLRPSQRRVIEKLNTFLIYGDSESSSSSNAQIKLNYQLGASDGLPPVGLDTLFYSKPSLQLYYNRKRESSKAKARRFIKSCDAKMKRHNIDLNEAIRLIRAKWNLRRSDHPDKNLLTLEDYLFPKKHALSTTDEIKASKFKHKLRIDLTHVNSPANQAIRQDEHEVLVNYQKSVHKEEPDLWTLKRYCEFLVKTPLTTELIENRDYTTPQLPKSCSSTEDNSVYSRDICKNPDDYLLVRPPSLPTHYGTYHCAYFLDDKLIAVGVLDVLPKCVTSVYFFYDPNYGHLNLGIYSALVEISLVRQISMHYEGPDKYEDKLVNYYMGFYVHECKKMHYKTTFTPSYLLCSETHLYVPVEECLNRLKSTKYARFSQDSLRSNSYEPDEISDPKEMSVVLLPEFAPPCKLRKYISFLGQLIGGKLADFFYDEIIDPYARLVGTRLMMSLTLRLNSAHRAIMAKYRAVLAQQHQQQMTSNEM